MTSQTNPTTAAQPSPANALPFKGTEFDFGNGQIFVIPPLTVRDLKRLKAEIVTLQQIGPVDMSASVDACITVVHAAMSRNYPTLTLDDVAGLLDIGNMLEVIKCVMNVNGQAFDGKGATRGASSPARHAGTPPAFWRKK
jgi:hypothetical protein